MNILEKSEECLNGHCEAKCVCRWELSCKGTQGETKGRVQPVFMLGDPMTVLVDMVENCSFKIQKL